MIVQTLVLAGMLVCGIFAISSSRLLVSALWLAGCSALLALALANLGALEVAVVELSVGAGLVTVIFVFAIAIAGDEPTKYASIVPRSLAWVLTGAFFLLLVWLTVPRLLAPVLAVQPLSGLQAIWQARALDTLLQVALIFCGVLGSLGLLSESESLEKATRTEGGAA